MQTVERGETNTDSERVSCDDRMQAYTQ